MSEIKNGGLDQYGAKPFEQQQFGTAGVEGVIGFSTALVTLHAVNLFFPSVFLWHFVYQNDANSGHSGWGLKDLN